jgi:hypothetical protein
MIFAMVAALAVIAMMAALGVILALAMAREDGAGAAAQRLEMRSRACRDGRCCGARSPGDARDAAAARSSLLTSR